MAKENTFDIDDVVEKVIFKLHPSYVNEPIVTLTKAPYEVKKGAWGSFDLGITIIFKECLDTPHANF